MKVYLDNAATTRVNPKVLEVMLPFLKEKFGNPSSIYSLGQEAKMALDGAREKVAGFLGARTEEVVFTSGATESINLAHKGLVEAVGGRPEIITTAVEHKAVLETCKHLEEGRLAEVTYLPVDRRGRVSLADLKKAVGPKTVLVSVMLVNNEVGTIQPIEEIGKFLKSQKRKIYFHTDATQGIQYLDCRVDRLGVDLLSMTGHKLQAPKGIGVLYIRGGGFLRRQQDGGGQEGGLRAGTENVAYAVGLAKALELAVRGREEGGRRIKKLREKLVRGVLKIPGVELTGQPDKRAPHIASFVIDGVEGEAVLMLLSDEGVAASSGSACTSGTLEPSHVLRAMGIRPEKAHGSLRLSLSKETTEEEIDYVLKVLPEVVAKLRKMAPKW